MLRKIWNTGKDCPRSLTQLRQLEIILALFKQNDLASCWRMHFGLSLLRIQKYMVCHANATNLVFRFLLVSTPSSLLESSCVPLSSASIVSSKSCVPLSLCILRTFLIFLRWFSSAASSVNILKGGRSHLKVIVININNDCNNSLWELQ